MIEIKGRGGISAKIIADSISLHSSKRIITLQLRYPRFIHGELMTHRLFGRNAASSRAIPVKKMIEQVRNDPAMPIHWGKNQPGMQANEENDALISFRGSSYKPDELWQLSTNFQADVAKAFTDAGYHKQVVNRKLEDSQFMQTVVTATEWDNFFALRDHKDAQPEIRELAQCMRTAMDQNKPETLVEGEWHLPYVAESELVDYPLEDLIRFSAARCARVSYLNHDQSEPNIEKDLALYDMLATRPFDDGKGHVLGDDDPVHLSPLEHQAAPMRDDRFVPGLGIKDWDKGVTHADKDGRLWSGNLQGWIQYRQVV